MKNTILTRFLPIIQKHIPGCTEDRITLRDNGYDHYVFVVDKTQAFRFPRSESHGKRDAVENRFLHTFATKSPVPIQNMQGHVDERSGIKYQTYKFLPGVPFTKEVASTLSEEALHGIAKGLGRFLATLHEFPVGEAAHMGMESLVSLADYGAYFKDILPVDKKLIGDVLTDEEWSWVEENIMTFYTLTQEYPFPFTVTHSDLVGDHLLIDEKNHKLSGVIDFSLRIADPANDFKYLDRYGDQFLKTVYKYYLPVDDYFEKRRMFYAGDFPIAQLYTSFTHHDAEHTLQNKVNEVKAYIATHT